MASGVTSSSRLGAFGRSAGGLLVTATALQHPDLFRAVLCEDGAVDLQYEYDHEKDSYLSEFANFNNPIERDKVQRYSPVRLASETTTSTRFLIVSHRFDQRVTAIASRRLQAAFAGKGTSSLLIEDSTGDHGSLSPSLAAKE
jgi:prolyl oligopeptidase